MAKTKKVPKAAKKSRTSVKKLPVGKKELTATESKRVKGGLLAELTAAGIPGGSPPSVTVGVGPIAVKKMLASELEVKK